MRSESELKFECLTHISYVFFNEENHNNKREIDPTERRNIVRLGIETKAIRIIVYRCVTRAAHVHVIFVSRESGNGVKVLLSRAIVEFDCREFRCHPTR